MTQISVRDAVHGDIDIAGDPDDFFLEALGRKLPALFAGHGRFGPVMLDTFAEDLQARYTITVDDTATLAQVAVAFGDQVRTRPASVRLTFGAKGGGGDRSWDGITLFTEIIANIDDVMRVGGYVSASLTGWRTAVGLYRRRTRRLAKDWIDTGEISLELRREVFRESTWRRKAFDLTFALGTDGPRLLRALGYERRQTRPIELWSEIATVDDPRRS